MAGSMKKGKFDFEDYLESMKQMRKMGGLSSILGCFPEWVSRRRIRAPLMRPQMKRHGSHRIIHDAGRTQESQDPDSLRESTGLQKVQAWISQGEPVDQTV